MDRRVSGGLRSLDIFYYYLLTIVAYVTRVLYTERQQFSPLVETVYRCRVKRLFYDLFFSSLIPSLLPSSSLPPSLSLTLSLQRLRKVDCILKMSVIVEAKMSKYQYMYIDYRGVATWVVFSK